jgi:hypothetical protein
LRACSEMSARRFPNGQLDLIGEFVAELEKKPALSPLFGLLVGKQS